MTPRWCSSNLYEYMKCSTPQCVIHASVEVIVNKEEWPLSNCGAVKLRFHLGVRVPPKESQGKSEESWDDESDGWEFLLLKIVFIFPDFSLTTGRQRRVVAKISDWVQVSWSIQWDMERFYQHPVFIIALGRLVCSSGQSEASNSTSARLCSTA